MKKQAAILGAVSVLLLILAAIAFQRPSGRIIVLLHLTDRFWIPLLLLLCFGTGAGALLLLHRIRRAQNKKGTVSLCFFGFLAALTVAEGYVLISRCSRTPEYHTMEKACVSPDGQHALWRVRRADFFGNSCDVYYLPGEGLLWYELFDYGQDGLPDITWGDTGFVFRGTSYSYQPDGTGSVIGPCT